MNESKQLLRDEMTFPANDVLRAEMGAELFGVYEKMVLEIELVVPPVEIEWRYYNDGKAWLGKAQAGARSKRKTVFWLSVWEDYWLTSFYFSEKNYAGVLELAIDQRIKDELLASKKIGKLIPLTMELRKAEDLKDWLKVVKYKAELK